MRIVVRLPSQWVPEITHHCQKTPFLLVGTQIDLRDDAATLEKLAKNKQKPISNEQGDKLAKELKAVKYVECSALTQVSGAPFVSRHAFRIAMLWKAHCGRCAQISSHGPLRKILLESSKTSRKDNGLDSSVYFKQYFDVAAGRNLIGELLDGQRFCLAGKPPDYVGVL